MTELATRDAASMFCSVPDDACDRWCALLSAVTPRQARLCGRSLSCDGLPGRSARQVRHQAGLQAAGHALHALSGRSCVVETGALGHPAVTQGGVSAQVSVSHDERLAVAVAFDARSLCGVDVECVDRPVDHFAYSVLDEAERALAARVADPRRAFLVSWTGKEGLAKLLRVGLTADLSIFGVAGLDVLGGDAYRVRFRSFPALEARSVIVSGHVATVVAPLGCFPEAPRSTQGGAE